MPEEPFVLFLSWTCYGNWLPGDPRGYVSNTLAPGRGYDPKENVPGTPYTADDANTWERAKALQKWPTVKLTGDEARTAAESLVAAAKKRAWRITRGAIMANHVHLVVAGCTPDGPAVRRILKGNSQADMSAKAGHPRKWWTEGGSDRIRKGERSIAETVKYVAEQERMLVEIVEMEVRVVGAA